MKKIHLSADSSQACRAKTTQQLLVEFFGGLAAMTPDLNSLDFDKSCVLQAKVQALPYSNLVTIRLSFAAEYSTHHKNCITHVETSVFQFSALQGE